MAKNEKATTQTASRTRKAALVLPSYSLKNVKSGESLFVRMDSEISSKPDLDEQGNQKLDKRGNPADIHLVNVTDLDTGACGQMVVPAIMFTGLSDAGAITGRCFELVKGAETKGKATKWEVYEIEA